MRNCWVVCVFTGLFILSYLWGFLLVVDLCGGSFKVLRGGPTARFGSDPKPKEIPKCRAAEKYIFQDWTESDPSEKFISGVSGPVRLSHKYLALHHSPCQLRVVSWIILNSAVRWGVLQLVLCLFVRRLGVNIAFLFPSVAAESLD